MDDRMALVSTLADAVLPLIRTRSGPSSVSAIESTRKVASGLA